jgi:hypothetical protein
MRKILNFALSTLAVVLMAAPAMAQSVAYNGKLHIGLSDTDNTTGFRGNNALPICAGGGPLINPGTYGTTQGTLLINAVGSGVAGVGGALTFNAVSPTNGGAQEKDNTTCNVAIPGFANPRLRSRTQVGAAHFPGRRGGYTTMINTQPVPATPTATYMLSAGNGNTNAVTVATWTTTAAPGALANTFMGAAFSRTAPFLGAGGGLVRAQPGAAVFGGGVPFSGGGGVQLGINFATTFGGVALVPGDYGLVNYANGFLPTDPQLFGTDAKGVNIANQVTTAIFTPLVTLDAGLINGTQAATYVGRTPGGTTRLADGAVLTVGGGNTATPAGTFQFGPNPASNANCALGIPFACPSVISPVGFTGLFMEWTTGAATWTDMIGDFYTIRKASGSDVAVAASTAVGGETRRLQVVSPWGATIRAVGPFGLPVPTLGFGGMSIMSLNVIPVPEPGTLAMLGFGIAGLVGLRSARRRS